MCFQKSLLTGMGVGSMKGSAAGHAAHTEHVCLLFFTVDFRPRFVPIHLSFLSPAIALRNEHLAALQSQLELSLPYVLSHRRLGHLRSRLFLLQAGPDSMRCVSLFPWRFAVRFQNAVNPDTHRPQLRLFPFWFLPRCWYRVPDRVAHHPPVHSKFPRHSLNRPDPMLVLSPHLLK